MKKDNEIDIKKEKRKKRIRNIICIIIAIIVVFSFFTFVYFLFMPSTVNIDIHSYETIDKIPRNENGEIKYYGTEYFSDEYHEELWVFNITISLDGYFQKEDISVYGFQIEYSTSKKTSADLRATHTYDHYYHLIPAGILKPGEELSCTVLFPSNSSRYGDPVAIYYNNERFELD